MEQIHGPQLYKQTLKVGGWVEGILNTWDVLLFFWMECVGNKPATWPNAWKSPPMLKNRTKLQNVKVLPARIHCTHGPVSNTTLLAPMLFWRHCFLNSSVSSQTNLSVPWVHLQQPMTYLSNWSAVPLLVGLAKATKDLVIQGRLSCR